MVLSLTGQRFGRLIAIERAGRSRSGDALWRCRCICGTETVVTASNLRGGNTTSCGCYRVERQRLVPRIHGKVGSRAYAIWKAMIQRCTNPKNPRWSSYGGRGILVCSAWQSFEGFYRDMGDPPDGASIDRTDNDLGYAPGNCQWATSQAQNRNRRSNRLITFLGKTQALSAWSEEAGIPYFTLHSRLRDGWSIDEALMTTVGGAR